MRIRRLVLDGPAAGASLWMEPTSALVSAIEAQPGHDSIDRQ